MTVKFILSCFAVTSLVHCIIKEKDIYYSAAEKRHLGSLPKIPSLF